MDPRNSHRRRLAGVVGFVLALSAAANSAGADIPAGFARIFDGKSTKGWHFSGTVHHGTTGIATVTKDGVLQLTQRPFGQGGLLLTDKVYKNFHLYLEVKVPFATNSGIFLRSFPLHRAQLCAGNDRRNLLAVGHLLRAPCALTVGPGCGLTALPVRRMRRTPRYGDH